MKVAAPKAILAGERRVALIPETCTKLKKAGLELLIERGAGAESGYADAAYEAVGATIVDDARLYAEADVIAFPNAPTYEQIMKFRRGVIVMAVINPLSNHDLVRQLATAGVTSMAMDLMPRITRAQKMDVLSSMSTVSGYKAVLMAAAALPKMFPLLMTAAGTITPARVLILGAGVAGLQAIATAKRLGAVVEAFDVRPVVKEQVESLGAKFVEVPVEAKDAQDAGGYAKEMSEDYKKKQMELVAKHAAASDVVISTALIPGRKAPILITAETVRNMHPGSIVIDLASEAGGNCELTKHGETVIDNGVQVMGPANLPSSIPVNASQMFSRNVGAFLLDLTKEGVITLNPEDECVTGTMVTKDGQVVHARVKETMGA
ncbi:MAG: Re/Si-specific NAD(P)(+) transhydrogenase subunit alpha [Planctomycetes bacterium]|nr:Re/Si-specific NAD(P)(+) transhydrogenase subunit alpha [Planctomycetota bacterium]